MPCEVEQIRERYALRDGNTFSGRYSFLRPEVYLAVQERERVLMRWIRECQLAPVAARRVLEIGCGNGQNLLDFLRYGFQPENLVGSELLPARAAEARRRLPGAIEVLQGDAIELDLPEGSFDVVFQSTVFSSILDKTFQHVLAEKMWYWVKPGGVILWYDFTFDNPRNPNVRGVPVSRIRELFPAGRVHSRRVTLAPPLARRLTAFHPALYRVANAIPYLRTHVVCWIRKPSPLL